MLLRNIQKPADIRVPGPAQDQPSWKRVGVIAAVGFIIGVVWPRVAGVRLGPALPAASSSVAALSASIAPALRPFVAGSTPPPVVAMVTVPLSASVASAPPVPPAAATHAAPPAPTPSVTPAAAARPPLLAPARSDNGKGEEPVRIVWDVALVRDAAAKSGKIVARLQRGTPIRIGPEKDGWYPVKYGEGFGSEGWVFRGAIGR